MISLIWRKDLSWECLKNKKPISLFGNLELLFPSCNFLLFFSEYLFSSSCSVGIGLPVYSTFKAIENRDQNEQHKWLTYWAAYGSFSLVEVFTDKLISWYV